MIILADLNITIVIGSQYFRPTVQMLCRVYLGQKLVRLMATIHHIFLTRIAISVFLHQVWPRMKVHRRLALNLRLRTFNRMPLCALIMLLLEQVQPLLLLLIRVSLFQPPLHRFLLLALQLPSPAIPDISVLTAWLLLNIVDTLHQSPVFLLKSDCL